MLVECLAYMPHDADAQKRTRKVTSPVQTIVSCTTNSYIQKGKILSL